MITEKERKIIEKCCKLSLLEVVSESKVLREKLSFVEHIKMAEWVRTMTYEESISAVFNNNEPLSEFGIRDFESKFKKFLKYGLAAIAGGIAAPIGVSMTIGAGVAMFATYMFRKLTDPCWQNCLRKFGRGPERKVCKYECQVEACRAIIRDVKAQINKCDETKRPLACEKKLNKEYIKWSKKLQEHLVHLQRAKAEVARRTKPTKP
ncbi:hypothetical protein KAR91_06625 [Candidatus Pacearchaeota archaeon]|nr:hypothetical protein [Candidatus Pacearchaeota archaeon]